MPSHNASSTTAQDLLLTELHIFEEAAWRNEEIGEKRFNFFVTLVTAVIGGLVVLWASDRGSADFRVMLPTLTWQATLALLIFGLLSYRRMVHRDRVTAEYRQASNHVRRFFRETYKDECPALRDFVLPHEIKNAEKAKESEWKGRLRRISQGGYTPTLGFLNGLLLVPVLTVGAGLTLPYAVCAGGILTVVLCMVGSKPHQNLGPQRSR